MDEKAHLARQLGSEVTRSTEKETTTRGIKGRSALEDKEEWREERRTLARMVR
jgi:hypothetical protein